METKRSNQIHSKDNRKKIMGKHHDKIKKALEQRIASTPNGAGFKKPGSMNKKKTGYRGQTAKGSK